MKSQRSVQQTLSRGYESFSHILSSHLLKKRRKEKKKQSILARCWESSLIWWERRGFFFCTDSISLFCTCPGLLLSLDNHRLLKYIGRAHSKYRVLKMAKENVGETVNSHRAQFIFTEGCQVVKLFRSFSRFMHTVAHSVVFLSQRPRQTFFYNLFF